MTTTTTTTPSVPTTTKGKVLRLSVVLLALIIAVAPHLSEGLEKFNSPWLKAIAAGLAVLSTLLLDALKVPLIRSVALHFLKQEAGVSQLEDISDKTVSAPKTDGVKP